MREAEKGLARDVEKRVRRGRLQKRVSRRRLQKKRVSCGRLKKGCRGMLNSRRRQKCEVEKVWVWEVEERGG